MMKEYWDAESLKKVSKEVSHQMTSLRAAADRLAKREEAESRAGAKNKSDALEEPPK